MKSANPRDLLTACLLTKWCSAQCVNTTTTIRNSADLSSINACKTFTGTIAVATDSIPIIELEGLELLDGDFVAANNTEVTTLASSTLVNATGSVEFSNLPVLTNITLPSWQSAQTLILSQIPNPTVTDFQPNGQQINEIYVRNTSLAFFAGLTLLGAQIQVLEIVDNPYLQLIEFGAGNITQQATVTGNSNNLKLILANLTHAYSLDISNTMTLGLPMLESVSDDLILTGNTFSNLSIPKLTFVGGDFNVSDNPSLTNISLYDLVDVEGSVDVEYNEQLSTIGGFPALSSIGGSLNLVGSYNKIGLPSLDSVGGDIYLQTTGTLNCFEVRASVGKGQYTCNASTLTASTTSTPTPSHSHGLSAGAIGGIAIGVVAVVALIVIAAMLLSRRKREDVQEIARRHAMGQEVVPQSTEKVFPSGRGGLKTHRPATNVKELPGLPAEYYCEMGRPTTRNKAAEPGNQVEVLGDRPPAHELAGDQPPILRESQVA